MPKRLDVMPESRQRGPQATWPKIAGFNDWSEVLDGGVYECDLGETTSMEIVNQFVSAARLAAAKRDMRLTSRRMGNGKVAIRAVKAEAA